MTQKTSSPLKKIFLAIFIVLLVGGSIFWATGGLKNLGGSSESVVQEFSGKKAFAAVKAQTDFGPRVPETEAHRKAGDWLVSELKSAGWDVQEQKGEIDHPLWNRKVPIRNIIASLNKERPSRVLLAAHWDTRPFAENDPIEKKKPLDGANDGASGVGILVEMAKLLKTHPPEVGVDIILWDFEDTGEPRKLESYCLGSQYWAQHPHDPNYTAVYGINLDMVGGFNAEFPRESYSNQVASFVYDRIEASARELNLQKYFPDRATGGIFDDHLSVIKYRSIPMVDLIHVDSAQQFVSTWHTLQDRIDAISPDTLEAVGKVLLKTIYQTTVK